MKTLVHSQDTAIILGVIVATIISEAITTTIVATTNPITTKPSQVDSPTDNPIATDPTVLLQLRTPSSNFKEIIKALAITSLDQNIVNLVTQRQIFLTIPIASFPTTSSNQNSTTTLPTTLPIRIGLATLSSMTKKRIKYIKYLPRWPSRAKSMKKRKIPLS